MAEVALVFGFAHTPYLLAPPLLWPQIRDRIRSGKPVSADLPKETSAELESKYQRCMAAFTKLRELIQKSGADAMIIIGDDQKEIFSSLVAGFTVYTGEKVEGKKYPGRVREVTGSQERISVASHPRLAKEIVDGLAKEDFDVAFFEKPENEEDGFGHAFIPPLGYLTPSLDLPIVPILVNCYYPPQPTAKRCYRFGRALRKILREARSVNRVAVGVSGGLWHTPGQEDATIDENFDRGLLETLAAGQSRKLAEMSNKHLVSGTGEIRNWIVGAGLTGRRKWDVLDYISLYYSPIGVAFAACAMEADL